MPTSIRSRLFYAIRNADVELAEAFAARCPEVSSIAELNRCFHRLLTQYDVNTQHLRLSLSDDIDVETWIARFTTHGILDFLRNNRFPPLTGNWDWGVYSNCG